MILTLLWNLLTWPWNLLVRLWNLLPLPSSWKIRDKSETNEVLESRDELRSSDGLTPEERRKRNLWLLRLMASLALPVILETLDYTVVATAQPKIASAFNRLDLQSYIGTVYLLTSTAFLPLFASLADVYGRHSTIQLALVFFIIGSAISTAAHDMPTMLAGRGIAGIGAAGLLTVLRTILADATSLNLNNIQGALMTFLYSVGFCVGPPIGGALVDVSFRWIFAINLPACALSMIMIFILLRKHIRRPLVGQNFGALDKLLYIDWTATFFFTVGGIGLLLGLNWGSSEGWDDPKVIVCLVVGAFLVGVTIAWEALLEHKQRSDQRQRQGDLDITGSDIPAEKSTYIDTTVDRSHLAAPYRATALLPLKVMGNFDVMATNFAALTSGMVMLVVFYYVALYFIIVSGQSATRAGIQLLFFAPGLGIGTVISIRMVSRYRQPKYPILIGSFIVPPSLGLVSMAINNQHGPQIKGFMILAGIGVGMTFGPLVMHARFSQPHDRVAIVSALNLFFRSLGGTIGLAQCATVTNAKVRAYFSALPLSELIQFQPLGEASFSAGDLTSIDMIESLPPEAQEHVRNAFRNGVRWSFISLIPWACISLFTCFFLRHIVDTDAERMKAMKSPEEPENTDTTVRDTPVQPEESRDEIKPEKRVASV